jgi:hypothetical protein
MTGVEMIATTKTEVDAEAEAEAKACAQVLSEVIYE